MNILINYDFVNAVKNVNESFSLKKYSRNNKVEWVKKYVPAFFAANLFICQGNVKNSISILPLQYFTLYMIEAILTKAYNFDIYEQDSINDLKRLVTQFRNADFNTSYELLKNSEQYDRKYEIRINENKLPEMIQSKYILVPYYDYYGKVKETSVSQEHVMGSKDYVLSLGSPKKVLKPAFSNI